jgi:hypothetical protein
MPAPKLSPELRERYTREYLDLLDRRDALAEELREETKERKGEIATLDKAAFRLRRLLGGKTDDQLEVPGAEIPHPKPRRGAAEVEIRAGEKRVTLTAESRSALNANIRAAESERAGKRGTKKFPPGAALEDLCTACHRPIGEHAGTKCPPERKGGR